MILSIILPFFILLGLSFLSLRRRPPKGYRLVPGPKGLPIIGNTLDVPQSRPEKKFMEWAREFGELYRIQMGWNDWVFVNSDVAAKVQSPPFNADCKGNLRQAKCGNEFKTTDANLVGARVRRRKLHLKAPD